MFTIVTIAIIVLSLAGGPGAVHASQDDLETRRAPTDGIWLEAVTTDPQADWNGDGRVSTLDESITLWNAGPETVSLQGWTLKMNDGTPEEQMLEGGLGAGQRLHLSNPDGQLNNDVVLVLENAAGVEIDRAALDGALFPSGNSDDALDETIRLAGVWAGQATPGTNGTALPPLWVQRIGREGLENDDLSPAWIEPGTHNVTFKLHYVDGHEPTNYTVLIGNQSNAVILADNGAWRAGPFAIPDAGSVSVTLSSSEVDLLDFPDGTSLELLIDSTPPVIDPTLAAGAVASTAPAVNGTGFIHWLPHFVDPESHMDHHTLHLPGENNTQTALECYTIDLPSPSCQLDTPNQNVTVRAANRAGGTTMDVTQPVWDSSPPEPPSGFTFAYDAHPRVVWTPFNEPLSMLRIEIADDVTGVYLRETQEIRSNSTSFEDTNWIPGDPRAYRLTGTDRVGLEAATEWIALPPDAVPIAWNPIDATNALAAQALGHDTSVVVHFDRQITHVPTLWLDVERPHPAHHELAGNLAANQTEASYRLPAKLPSWGAAQWRISGGEGSDGAPLQDAPKATSWDRQAPTVDGLPTVNNWMQTPRYVMTLHARDGLDAKPVLHVEEPGPSISIGRSADQPNRVDLVFKQQGRHTITGSAADGDENTMTFNFTVGLDNKPPTVQIEHLPDAWSSADPIRVRIIDTVSGVNASSIRAWVQGQQETTQAEVLSWSADVVALAPPGNQSRPDALRIHLAVSDRAGNLAEGLLEESAMPEAPSQTTTYLAHGLRDAPTPAASGPTWANSPSAPQASNAGTTANGSTSSWPEPLGPATQTHSATNASKPQGWLGLAVVAAGGLVGLGTVVRRRRLKDRQTPSNPPGGR